VIARRHPSQKKAIFLVFDGGRGVGHLRRLSQIAKTLQGKFACLIVTGHRAAANWFVPKECEYVHIPSWDSLLESKAQYWGRQPFISLDDREAVKLRRGMLTGIVDSFKPDVMFVDHLPLGFHEELSTIVKDTPCLKYLVTRGFLNETEDIDNLILGGKAGQYLELYYHRILVAADRRVFDFATHYNISPALRNKTVHTGYVTESVRSDVVSAMREERGLRRDDVWVVVSAGGGQLGEPLIEMCLNELVGRYVDIVFDVVMGPRSNLKWPESAKNVIDAANLRLHKETAHLRLLHAAADLVITTGGFTSILEILQGNAKILSFPYRKDERDEPYHHAVCLRKFVDIQVSTDLSCLPALFEDAIRSIGEQCRRPDERGKLDFNGAEVIQRIVTSDMELISQSC
jgi:predicted glycosyltransferase